MEIDTSGMRGCLAVLTVIVVIVLAAMAVFAVAGEMTEARVDHAQARADIEHERTLQQQLHYDYELQSFRDWTIALAAFTHSDLCVGGLVAVGMLVLFGLFMAARSE